ncbi:GerMN domain-containing protein [Spirochaeta dissipatitropha]
MGRSRTRKRVSLGIIFWIAFILFILVFFLLSRQNIQQVMETTGLLEILQERLGVGGDTPDPELENLIPLPEITVKPGTETESPTRPETQPTQTTEPSIDLQDDGARRETEKTTPEEPQSPDRTADKPDASTPTASDTPVPAEGSDTRAAPLYYILVNDAGNILPRKITRTMPATQTPLTANLQALIAGPTADELREGVLNLIPPGSQLLSASISNRVAYLNFNENFRFNSLGTEGIIAQLQQIVYTATEFGTIDRVQFLINGQQLEYLGGDGVYIGQPLGRNSFR